jgi:hypothetical protein
MLVLDHMFKQHREKVKRTPQTPANSCGQCDRSFMNGRQLKFHVKSAHQTTAKKIFQIRIPDYLKVAGRLSGKDVNKAAQKPQSKRPNKPAVKAANMPSVKAANMPSVKAADIPAVEEPKSVKKNPINRCDYKCCICGDMFETSDVLSGHIQNVHEVIRQKPMSRICKLKFVRFALNAAGSKMSCARKLFK